MRALERETRILMHGDRKFRAMEIHDGVARFATVLVRSLGELSVMRVLVAVRALPKIDFKHRVGARRNMALVAFHSGVFAHQRICRRRMLLHAE